jgi:hypothetical protein
MFGSGAPRDTDDHPISSISRQRAQVNPRGEKKVTVIPKWDKESLWKRALLRIQMFIATRSPY